MPAPMPPTTWPRAAKTLTTSAVARMRAGGGRAVNGAVLEVAHAAPGGAAGLLVGDRQAQHTPRATQAAEFGEDGAVDFVGAGGLRPEDVAVLEVLHVAARGLH